MPPRNAHWLIELAIHNGILLARGSPKLILSALINPDHLMPGRRPYERPVDQTQIAHQSRVDHARMHTRARDDRVAPRELGGVEDVRKLGLSIANPVPDDGCLLSGADVLKVDPVTWVALEPQGGVAHYADVGVGELGGREKGGQEELEQQGVAHMVRAELHLVPVASEAWRCSHDAGVAEDDVEAGDL